MRLIIAGTEEIYRRFCRTHKLHPAKEATFIHHGYQFRGLHKQEVIETCQSFKLKDIWEIYEMLKVCDMTVVRIPCEPGCRDYHWDKTEL